MRITGGFLKGRTFYPPAGKWPTRPTTDIAREGLFNILSNMLDFEATAMLDLFGGTGAHGYEMISRGCQNVVYVDKFMPCLNFVKKTAIEFDILEFISLKNADYEVFINTNIIKFNYIFAGPPYPLPNLDQIPDKILAANMIQENGLLVLEHNPQYRFEKHPFYWKSRNYGETFFSFFRP
ncbi:MAG: RsmD family RNA methyltransferase [Saprospiraceae bacterium]|nr:RsmD family RNA methyltransferase [Saprospiraceae bacterium]